MLQLHRPELAMGLQIGQERAHSNKQLPPRSGQAVQSNLQLQIGKLLLQLPVQDRVTLVPLSTCSLEIVLVAEEHAWAMERQHCWQMVARQVWMWSSFDEQMVRQHTWIWR